MTAPATLQAGGSSAADPSGHLVTMFGLRRLLSRWRILCRGSDTAFPRVSNKEDMRSAGIVLAPAVRHRACDFRTWGRSDPACDVAHVPNVVRPLAGVPCQHCPLLPHGHRQCPPALAIKLCRRVSSLAFHHGHRATPASQPSALLDKTHECLDGALLPGTGDVEDQELAARKSAVAQATVSQGPADKLTPARPGRPDNCTWDDWSDMSPAADRTKIGSAKNKARVRDQARGPTLDADP